MMIDKQLLRIIDFPGRQACVNVGADGESATACIIILYCTAVFSIVVVSVSISVS